MGAGADVIDRVAAGAPACRDWEGPPADAAPKQQAGTPAATQSLASFCKSEVLSQTAFAPMGQGVTQLGNYEGTWDVDVRSRLAGK